MNWDVLVQNDEVEAALRDAGKRRMIDAPSRTRMAVSGAFKRRPEITVEVGTTYATLVLHDRESGRGLDQAKQRCGSITPGLFEVNLAPDVPSDGGESSHLKGRFVTIQSDDPNRIADLTKLTSTPNSSPLYTLHPNTSLCLANVLVGRRSTVPVTYRLPLALIIVFGNELPRSDAGLEADLILSNIVERAVQKSGMMFGALHQ